MLRTCEPQRSIDDRVPVEGSTRAIHQGPAIANDDPADKAGYMAATPSSVAHSRPLQRGMGPYMRLVRAHPCARTVSEAPIGAHCRDRTCDEEKENARLFLRAVEVMSRQ